MQSEGEMGLQVIRGESNNQSAAEALAATLQSSVDDGTVYLGYPILATADDQIEVDALLVSEQCGLVAFLFAEGHPTTDSEWEDVIEEQDRLYAVLDGFLSKNEGLRRGRRLAFDLITMTVLPGPGTPPSTLDSEGIYTTFEQIPDFISTLSPIGGELERNLQGALQRVSTIKPPKKRQNVSRPGSRGSVMREIERCIANLDRWQKAAAIESPAGPQRIRGLAGSGKTVVLALKAAYWHTQHPEWRIVLTFQSRSLYQQAKDLVTRFTFEYSNDFPNDEFMRVLHSWGSAQTPGVYAMIANALGETPRNWAYAAGEYGRDGAFAGVCRELLQLSENQETTPIFDAVLIDEAQDLPPEFFQLVYRFTQDPKRIVWGFDELQKLSETAMPSTLELFGTDKGGESLISLESQENEPHKDIVLPVCYRNTPWALATAHAVGTGIYRDGGLVQHPDSPQLWNDIGYQTIHGQLAAGQKVTLKRSPTSYPSYFEELVDPDDAVVFQQFDTELEQDEWVASQIDDNLQRDELEPDDILVVLPDTYRAKSRGPRLMKVLTRHGIDSHLVGVNASTEEVFRSGSVAIAHIHRAKGNEAPMVYVVDSQFAVHGVNAVTRRNTVFTAITRSRAWVRITGWGEKAGLIAREIEQTKNNNFELKFKVPTSSELAEIRRIHRDRTESEEATVAKGTEAFTAFLEALDSGEMDIQDLPPNLRTRLTRLNEQRHEPHT